jgi:hypothetical protein
MFVLLYCRQEFPVDGKDFPLSMSQYYNLMSWCRIPQRNIDTYVAGLEPGNRKALDFFILL